MTAALGPSAAEPPLPGGGWLPLFATARPSPWLVSGLLALAVATGAGAVIVGLSALARGWTPAVGALLIAGATATVLLVLVPPLGSADALSYAAYGRMADTGHDPYAYTPSAYPHDPVINAVEAPWRNQRTVYGPLATAEQRVIAHMAGRSVRTAVALLDIVNGIAFLAAGALLVRLRRGDVARQREAAMLFVANPLVLLVAVSGAHVDALAVLFVVGALVLLRRRPTGAGVLAGAAAAIKVSAALPAVALAWVLRRSSSALTRLVAGGAAVVLAAYAFTGLHALAPARAASRFVSIGTPWRAVRSLLEHVVSGGTPGNIVSFLAGAVVVAVAVRLLTAFRGATDDPLEVATYTGVALTLAWTLAATYVLGWYDIVPWALLALAHRSRLDRVLTAHTAMLALAYTPGRVVPLPSALDTITHHMRATVSPIILGGLVVVTLLMRQP